MFKNIRFIIIPFVLIILNGCSSGYQSFYKQQAPKKYQPTNDVKVIMYPDFDVDEIQELFFDDYLVLGRASFNGSLDDPRDAKEYAKSIGADILLAGYQNGRTRTSVMSITLPETQTASFSGSSSGGSFIMPLKVKTENQ